MNFLIYTVAVFVTSFSSTAFLEFAFDKQVILFSPMWWSITFFSIVMGFIVEKFFGD